MADRLLLNPLPKELPVSWQGDLVNSAVDPAIYLMVSLIITSAILQLLLYIGLLHNVSTIGTLKQL